MFNQFIDFIYKAGAILSPDQLVIAAIAVIIFMSVLGFILTCWSITARSKRNIAKYNASIRGSALVSLESFHNLDILINRKRSCLTTAWASVYPDNICGFVGIANSNNIVNQARPNGIRRALLFAIGLLFAAYCAITSVVLCVIVVLYAVLITIIFDYFDAVAFVRLSKNYNKFLGHLYKGTKEVYGVKTCVCPCANPEAKYEKTKTPGICNMVARPEEVKENMVCEDTASASELAPNDGAVQKPNIEKSKPIAKATPRVTEPVAYRVSEEERSRRKEEDNRKRQEEQERREQLEEVHRNMAALAKQVKTSSVQPTRKPKSVAGTLSKTDQGVASAVVKTQQAPAQLTKAATPSRIVTQSRAEREVVVQKNVESITVATQSQSVYTAKESAVLSTSVSRTETDERMNSLQQRLDSLRAKSSVPAGAPSQQKAATVSGKQKNIFGASKRAPSKTLAPPKEQTGKYNADEVHSALASLLNATQKDGDS
jgi:hypothetical protein